MRSAGTFSAVRSDPSTTRTVDGKIVRSGSRATSSRRTRSPRSPRICDILGQYYKPQLGTLINNSFFPVSNQAGFNQTQFSTKSDYNITTNQRLSGSFVFVDRPRTLLDQGGAWNFDDPNGGPFSRARLQWVSSHYVRWRTITP